MECDGRRGAMKRVAAIASYAPGLLITVWIAQALLIVSWQHHALALQIQADHKRSGASQPELASFSQRYHLMVFRSIGPLLKRPFRHDVRLYYVRSPRFHTSGDDAWAVRERDGRWFYKIHS